MKTDKETMERDAFVSHMASVGVTDMVWTAEMGPVGYRDNHNAMLSVEWERFAAGYRAALAVAPATGEPGAVRRFPIMGGPSIPWWVIAPHEAQAQRNHGGQTLERLAERGGLSPTEALCVIEDRAWARGRDAKADHDSLAAMVVELDRPAPPATGDAAAVALLADARKCVALANTNGYYDVWLARCDAILRAIPLPAPATDAVEKAREAFYEAARILGPVIADHSCEPEGRAARKAADVFDERLFALQEAHDALLAAERDAKGGSDAR